MRQLRIKQRFAFSQKTPSTFLGVQCSLPSSHGYTQATHGKKEKKPIRIYTNELLSETDPCHFASETFSTALLKIFGGY